MNSILKPSPSVLKSYTLFYDFSKIYIKLLSYYLLINIYGNFQTIQITSTLIKIQVLCKLFVQFIIKAIRYTIALFFGKLVAHDKLMCSIKIIV